MKTIISILILCFLISCKSSKFDKTIPFKIEKSTFQNWVGGQPGNRGIKIEFLVSNLKENIKFNEVYFKNEVVKLYERNSVKNTIITANINTITNDGLNMIMHKNANKEYGNKPPKKKVEFPFELKDNECVISYLENKKEHFYKLILTKEKDIFYP